MSVCEILSLHSIRNVHVMLFIKQLPLVQFELSAENIFSSEGWRGVATAQVPSP